MNCAHHEEQAHDFADDHDACSDGGASDGSTMMSAAPPISARLALRLECWAPWAHLVATVWWPVVQFLQRRSAESTAWARVHNALRRALPWAFRTVVEPSLSGAGMIPVAGGRMLHLPMVFGGERGLMVKCNTRAAGTLRPPPKEMSVRRDSFGNVRGWRMVAR